MDKKSLSRKKLLKRVSVYFLMVASTIIITAFVSLFTLGYRFDSNDGQIERYAMVQFNSVPSGATVFIDGVSTSIKTPDKATVKAGSHTIVMQLEGYKVWSKTIEIEAGALDWLNYALLVPENLVVEPVLNFKTIASSLPSPDAKYILIQTDLAVPEFNLIDISTKDVKPKVLTVPATSYANSSDLQQDHQFRIDKWDDGERYVLLKHTFGPNTEWLVVDTEDVTLTKNITTIFDFEITDMWFNGSSGNNFFALGGGDIRKLDVSAGTISRPLVSDVDKFSVYDSKIICYVSKSKISGEKNIGLFRDGDDVSYVIKSYNNSDDVAINADFTNYFNEYYLAISIGKSVEILNGSFPTSPQVDSLKTFATVESVDEIGKLSFSPSGRYLLGQSKTGFVNYDLERKKNTSSRLEVETDSFQLKWLNDNYVWSDGDGKLTIREFDGENVHFLNAVISGQVVTLTSNDKYIYSINSNLDGTSQLQRTLIRI